MRRLTLPVMFCFLVGLVCLGHHTCQGAIEMSVDPYPARVYQQAPAGFPVLKVHAQGDGMPVSSFRLESRGLSEYFVIDNQGHLNTAKVIDREIGFSFKFFVFAVIPETSSVEWKHVIVEVTEKNMYPPVFSQQTYNSSMYRFSTPGTVITTLSATDLDLQPYNRQLTFLAPSPQPFFHYVNVTSHGDVIVVRPPPDVIMVASVNVQVVDGGSPQRTGTALLTIAVDDAKDPDTFCVSTIGTEATLCWKNPMPGRTNPGYRVTVQGTSFAFHEYVKGESQTMEFCVLVTGLTLDEDYTFRVTLDTANGTSTPDTEVTFGNDGPGFSVDCVEHNFAACSYLHPCENGARCVTGDGGGLNYTCVCPSGWQGQNCTQMDLCTYLPCQNNGHCRFTGHRQYSCVCPLDFFGDICQHHNVCMAGQTCQNGGLCRMKDDGSHSCQCPHHFTGPSCSDPDPCWPSPCGEGGDCVKVSDTEANCSCYHGYSGARCDKADPCQSDPPCRNGATCTTTGDRSVRCLCPPQFTGPLCELYDACPHVCENNATCDMSLDGSYNCHCQPGYYGNECQHYDRCHDNPCGNNGSCNMNDSLPLCQCQPGFSGHRCTQFSPCLTDPCQGHGHCVEVMTKDVAGREAPYECQCFHSWWGDRCQYPNTCQIDVCQNGATCLNVPPSSFRCKCPPGYYARDCSRYNPCNATEKTEELCYNGGVCHAFISGFWCMCPDGYYGEQCQYRNPCHSSPCLHSGHCHNISDTDYTCSCPANYLGDRCQYLNDCTHSPCLNGGSCRIDPNHGTARCACPEGFLGYFCQVTDVCFSGHSGGRSSWCQNGSCGILNVTALMAWKGHVEDPTRFFGCRCLPGFTGKRCDVLQPNCLNVRCHNYGHCRHGACVCPSMFTGKWCENSVSGCDPDPCPHGLRCQATGTGESTCVCLNGWSPPDCTPGCLAITSQAKGAGRLQWPTTLAGQTAEVTCPYGRYDVTRPQATRHCSEDGHGGAEWEIPAESNCRRLDLHGASQRLNVLRKMTSNPAIIDTAEMEHVTSALEHLYTFTLMDRQVATDMIHVISNLCDVNVSVTVSSSRANNTSHRLVTLLEDYSADVTLTESEHVILSSANIEVLAVLIRNTTFGFNHVPSVIAGNGTVQIDMSVAIPPEAFLPQPKDVTSEQQVPRVQMIGYRNSHLFIPEGSFSGQNQVRQHPVVSAILTGRQVVDLSTPVVITRSHLQPSSNYTCVYWDIGNRSWSTEGVVTVRKGDNSTECQSSHLTSFAVLLDPTPEYQLGELHEAVLTYISYTGSAISLLCIAITITTYALFRSLNQDKSGKILIHLCLALFLLNVFFLANSLATSDTHDDLDACTAVAVMLHYCLLSSLGWMMVEAVEMYQALVTVFSKYVQCYMIKRCVLAWGLPVVIVAITVGVDRNNYHGDRGFCFISSSRPGAYYGSIIAPACVVLVFNTFIFVRVTRILLRPRFQQPKAESLTVTVTQVRGAFTVMVLVGVTWLLGPLAVRDAKLVFNYLFCVLNSLQGFLIFLFRCVLNPEARLCWLQLLTTGTLKKRRGTIRSYMSSDTSSKGYSRSGSHYRNGSMASTLSSDTRRTSKHGSDGSSKIKLHNGHHNKGYDGEGYGQVKGLYREELQSCHYSHDGLSDIGDHNLTESSMAEHKEKAGDAWELQSEDCDRDVAIIQPGQARSQVKRRDWLNKTDSRQPIIYQSGDSPISDSELENQFSEVTHF